MNLETVYPGKGVLQVSCDDALHLVGKPNFVKIVELLDGWKGP